MGAMRARVATSFFDTQRVDHEVLVSERTGHARDLAHGAVARGATIVCAWGGDGTVNEVSSALAFGSASLAIVPAGSGNGLARELRIPKQPAAALGVAVHGVDRTIDAGELGGRLFVNLAGIGFDAAIARRFADRAPGRRGFFPYLLIAAREMVTYTSERYSVVTGNESWEGRAFMIVLANARQYGNGAFIAPQARPDDGRLDLVVVETTSRAQLLRRIPRVFKGTLAGEPGVIRMMRVEDVEIATSGHPWMHVDGEPAALPGCVRGRVHPGAIRVRVPRPTAQDSVAPSTNR